MSSAVSAKSYGGTPRYSSAIRSWARRTFSCGSSPATSRAMRRSFSTTCQGFRPCSPSIHRLRCPSSKRRPRCRLASGPRPSATADYRILLKCNETARLRKARHAERARRDESPAVRQRSHLLIRSLALHREHARRRPRNGSHLLQKLRQRRERTCHDRIERTRGRERFHTCLQCLDVRKPKKARSMRDKTDLPAI